MTPSDVARASGSLAGFAALFGKRSAAPTPCAARAPAASIDAVDRPAESAALDRRFAVLRARIDEQRRALAGGAGLATEANEPDPRAERQAREQRRKAERLRRMALAHTRMRTEIVALHDQLGTGIRDGDLDALRRQFHQWHQLVTAGSRSERILERLRVSIVQRLYFEAGGAAIECLVERLAAAGLEWPSSDDVRPGASAEARAADEHRRRADLRQFFLASRMDVMGDLSCGIIAAWGSDYPEPGTRLWREVALRAAGAGIRGRLLQQYRDGLQGKQERLLTEIEGLVASELRWIEETIEAGIHSVDGAERIVTASMARLDQVVQELALQYVREDARVTPSTVS